MSVSEGEIILEDGASYQETYTWYDENNSLVDLTSYTASFTARAVNAEADSITLSSSSGVTLGGALGTISLVIPEATVSALPNGFAGYYCLDLTLSGVVTRVRKGSITKRGKFSA